MAADQTVVDAVLRKLNVTWEDEVTEARVNDAIEAVSPALALRLGLDAAHEFAPGEPDWGLFLNACLYEFSDALDDFFRNYAEEVGAAHLRNVMETIEVV